MIAKDAAVAAAVYAAFEASVSVWSRPAGGARAGGDWCEAVAVSKDTIAITVGDVWGHGDAAAERMAAIRASVLRPIREICAPSEILLRANEATFNHGDSGIVTAIVAFFNCRQRTLTFANAGHPPPLLLTTDQHAFLAHPPADIPLGVYAQYRTADYVIALPAETMLVFYTDGITEHDRDPIRGEIELAAAARRAFQRPNDDAAQTVARQLLGKHPALDDAAAMVLRTAPSTP